MTFKHCNFFNDNKAFLQKGVWLYYYYLAPSTNQKEILNILAFNVSSAETEIILNSLTLISRVINVFEIVY